MTVRLYGNFTGITGYWLLVTALLIYCQYSKCKQFETLDGINDVVSITDAKDVAPSPSSSFMWPSCRCPPRDDDEVAGGHGHFVGRKPNLCGANEMFDFGHVDELSTYPG